MIKKITHSFSPFNHSLLKISFSYINHNQLESIKASFKQNSKMQQSKMWMAYFKHRIVTGAKDMKQEVIHYYYNIRSLQNPTPYQLAQAYRIRGDLKKLGPVFFIYILPMSPLFFLIYLKYFPDSLPSWFQVDKQYTDRQQRYRINKLKAIKQLNYQQIEFESADIKTLKILATALTGKYIDGTFILNQIFKNKYQFTFENPPLPILSKFLIKRQIKKALDNDPYLHNLPYLKSITQKIRYKLGSLSEF